jgi:hypothetical protein
MARSCISEIPATTGLSGVAAIKYQAAKAIEASATPDTSNQVCGSQSHAIAGRDSGWAFSPRSFCLAFLCKCLCAIGYPPKHHSPIAPSKYVARATPMRPQVARASRPQKSCKILPHEDVFSIAVARRNPVRLACDSEPEGLHGNDTLDSHKRFTVHPLRRMVRL